MGFRSPVARHCDLFDTCLPVIACDNPGVAPNYSMAGARPEPERLVTASEFELWRSFSTAEPRDADDEQPLHIEHGIGNVVDRVAYCARCRSVIS